MEKEHHPSNAGNIRSVAVKSKIAVGGPKMANRVFGHSRQLSLNNFFVPSIPSMRKFGDREKKWGGEMENIKY